MNVKTVIFDMDGVLVDSEPFFRNKVFEFYKRQGIYVPLKEISQLAGSSHQFTFSKMVEWYGKEITLQQMESLYHSETKDILYSYADMLNPYIRYILRKLKPNYKLAVASSSSLQLISKCLKECSIDSYFDLVVTGRSFKESKPHPEIYLYTAKQLNSSPDECVVLEDSTIGITAAKSAGMYTLAHRDLRFDFDQSTADYVFDDFLEAYIHILDLSKCI